MQKRELFSIADTPYRGLRSHPHPLSLKPGEAADAINLRAQPGHAIQVRNGIAQELDTNGLPANAVFYGASPLVPIQHEDWLLYLAAEDPADQKIHIYNRRYRPSTGWNDQWHELTQSSGPFGDTRLSKPNEGLVAMTPVDSDPDARNHLDYLGATDSLGPAVVVQNGKDRPLRITGYPGAATTEKRLVPIKPIDPPIEARSTVAEAGVFDSLPVRTGAVTTAATPGGTFTAATGGHILQTGSAGSFAWEWKTGTTVTPGDTADVVMDSDEMSVFDTRSVRQLGFLVEAEDPTWWDCVRIWAHTSKDSGAYAWELIHDPIANGPNNRTHVPTNIEEIVVSAYAYPKRTQSEHSSITINGIRIEVASDALTPATKFIVRWVYASGWVPGTAQYAVARMAALSEAESGGVIVASGAFGLTTSELREPWQSYLSPPELEDTNARFVHPLARGASVPPSLLFPIDPRLFYHYSVPVVNPTLHDLETSFVDTWSIYRKDPGDAEFYLVDHVQVGEIDGEDWALTLDPNEGSLFYWADKVPPEEKDFRRRAPDAYNQVTPIGTCDVYANKRLYVGESIIDASGTNRVGNVVKISEEGFPGRFRALVRFDGLIETDASSGYEARLGIEYVRALAVVDGGTNGTSVLCLTDQSLYTIDRATSGERLFNVRRLAAFGTQSKHANATHRSEFFWLDSARALRTTRGLANLSRDSVQDRLDAATQIDKCTAVAHKDRIYLSRPLEERVLVYDTLSQLWESDDQLPEGLAVAQFVRAEIEGGSRLLYFAPDCTLYEYEAEGQSTDVETAITFALESGAHHNTSFGPIAAQRVCIVGDIAPAVLTTKRIFSEPASTVTGEIDLDIGGALVWKYDMLPGGGIPGGEGQAVAVRIEADFDAPFSLLALAAEIEPTDLSGPRI